MFENMTFNWVNCWSRAKEVHANTYIYMLRRSLLDALN